MTSTVALRLALLVLLVAAMVSAGRPFLRHFQANRRCCQIPLARNAVVTWKEMRGQASYYSEIGQDKWVLETMFPGVSNGFFVDVGSAHGTIGSNSRALEERGWTGLCIDPFPVHMEGRTCRVVREVVFSVAGRRMAFHQAGGLGGLAETLAPWNDRGARAPTTDFTTVTLDDVLARLHAPTLVHFLSLDIEGAELEALKGFPFERVRIGALAVEHNWEEPKRSQLRALLEAHGYVRVHSWRQDDFYAPAAPRETGRRRSAPAAVAVGASAAGEDARYQALLDRATRATSRTKGLRAEDMGSRAANAIGARTTVVRSDGEVHREAAAGNAGW